MIPKFRAWDKKHKQIIKVISLNWYEHILDYNVVGLFPNTESVARFWDETIVMQSTGLKDKNGLDIFEGDIAKLGEGDAYHLCVVEFNNDESCFQLTNRKTIGEYIGELLFVRGKYMAECEVIGNLYENPELLEVAE